MLEPEEVSAMLRLKELGWGAKRIAQELGVSRLAEHLTSDGHALAVRLRTSADLDLRSLNPFKAQSFELLRKAFLWGLGEVSPRSVDREAVACGTSQQFDYR